MIRCLTRAVAMVCLLPALSLCFFAQSSYASPLPTLPITVSDGSSTTSETLNLVGVSNPDGSIQYVGSDASLGFEYNIKVYPDPEVDAFYSVKNTSGVTQNYSIPFTLSLGGTMGAGSLTSGSISGELSNSNVGGSSTLSSYGGLPIYQSIVDGSNWQPLLSSPFLLTTTTTANTPDASFGDLVTTLAYPNPITNSIGITLNFALSPGGLVGFTGNFIVVPEPSTFVLLGAGLIGLAAAARRRGARR